MALTDTERERLRVWSATKVLGWHQEERVYADLRAFVHTTRGPCWVDQDGRVQQFCETWNPPVLLDQAFRVLERVMSDKPDLGIVISHMYQGEHTWQPPDPVQWIIEADAVGLDLRIDDKPLPELLLVACADAAGEKWRDE